jgi:threonine/homoserine/homoserine lactone efflux protein
MQLTSDFFSPALAVALTAYAVGVASPGPSNMAIMAAAMSRGRRQALALAAGVVCGSLVWGLAAALGLSALMHRYSWALVAFKVLGGLYLLYLAARAARAALAAQPPEPAVRSGADSKWRAFTGGLAMHLTNPKAIFVWLSIVALALPAAASRSHALGVVASCAVIGALVFFGYALAFSTQAARRMYARAHRWFNAALSAAFAVAGLRLLLSRGAG